jgi:hypothetical protein
MAKSKPLGLSLKGRPELWYSVEIDLGDDEPRTLRCKYWIFEEDELREKQREDLGRIIDSADSDDETRTISSLRNLVDQLSDEQAGQRLKELKTRLLDWDMRDLDSSDGRGKLPCNAENIEAACKITPIFQALYRGLLESSGDVRKKA